MKMGGMEACGSWFGASTLLKNVKKLWLPVSQVVNFRKLSVSPACRFYLCLLSVCLKWSTTGLVIFTRSRRKVLFLSLHFKSVDGVDT